MHGRRAGWSLPAQHIARPAVALLVGFTLLAASLAGASPSATAQQTSASADPRSFSQTGYSISNDAFWDYFQHRGGIRTFGYPVSNVIRLLGKPTQIFQRQILQLEADGSVSTLNLLDDGVLPITRVNGSTFPPAIPSLTTSLPAPDSDGYLDQVLGFVAQTAPDRWNGLPVDFGQTFRETVACSDALGAGAACSDQLLAGFALEIWGLPTSQPAPDPNNPDFVYQRFQRGIMQYSRGTGATEGLLLGDWFKKVVVGADLPPDLAAQVVGSPFYAQYSAFAPSGVARPQELPQTSLAGAFGSDVASVALGLPARQEATAAATATPTVGTPGPTSTPTVSPDATQAGCLGDEQMFFVPRKPYSGTNVDIVVTSSRHHDDRYVRLTGPVNSGQPTERQTPTGWAWAWTVSPTIEGWYEWAFYANGMIPCIVSGFTVQPIFGATATPTKTPELTATPTPETPTATPTPGTPGSVTVVSPAPAKNCGTQLSITGTNFGTTQSQYNGQVLFAGVPASITTWNNSAISFFIPTGLTTGQTYQIIVTTNGGASNPVSYTIGTC